MSRPRKAAPPADSPDLMMTPTLPIRSGEARRFADIDVPLSQADAAKSPPAFISEVRLTPPRPSGLNSSLPLSRSFLRAGQVIGDFDILSELARGGMGVIYKARQRSLNRIVALKMVLRGDFARLEDLLRFRAEAQAIAHLQHPNLVGIHEIGDFDGLPFYSMEYLAGGTLARRLNHKPIPPQAAVPLMLSLARAMEHAHSQGIVHRDLKPTNILLTDSETPLDRCIAKITDFGIAKRLDDRENLTRTGEILGTPSYMAPEQATGHAHGIGPAADIYSLGAILYELLVGNPPFQGSDGTETLLRVIQQEPPSLRQIDTAIPRDLETITLKCLEKDPAKRYPTAGAFAEDLRRYLGHEPILARPASAYEKAKKWVRRRPVLATTLAASFLLLAVALGSLVTVWRQAVATAKVETEMAKAKEQNLVQVQTLLADALLERGIALAEKNDVRRGLHWMVRSLDLSSANHDRNPKAAAIDNAVRFNLAHWSHVVMPPELLLPHRSWAWDVGFSPDGKFAVTASHDKNVRIWDTITGQPVGAPLPHRDPVWSVLWEPSGKYLFTGSGRIEGNFLKNGEIRVYQVDPAKPGHFLLLGTSHPTNVPIDSLAFSPKGNFLLAMYKGGNATLLYFDPSKIKPLGDVGILAQLPVSKGRFSPDGKRLFLASHSGDLHVYDMDGKSFLQPPWKLSGPIVAMELSPNGRTLMACAYEIATKQSTVSLWDLESDRKISRVMGFPGLVKRLAFSSDSQQVAISVLKQDGQSFQGEVRVAEIKNASGISEPFTPLSHPLPVWSLSFSRDGRFLITGCEDGNCRVWDVTLGRLALDPLQHEGNVTNLAISPDGQQVLTGCAGGNNSAQARLWILPTLATTPLTYTDARTIIGLRWEKDGRHFLADDVHGTLSRWDAVTRQRLERIEFPEVDGPLNLIRNEQSELAHCYSKTAMRLELFDLKTRLKIQSVPDFDLFWEDAHPHIVAGMIPIFRRQDSRLFLYRVSDNKPNGPGIVVPYTPFGHFGHDATKRTGAIWHKTTKVGKDQDISTGSEVHIWDLNLNTIQSWKFKTPAYGAIFNPKGDTVAIVGDHQIQFYQVATGAPAGPALSHAGQSSAMAFHPSGEVLSYSTVDGTIRSWHVASGKHIGRAIQLASFPAFLKARPDGVGFLAAANGRRTLEWSHLTPVSGSPDDLRTWVENLTGMTMDDRDDLHPIDPAILHERRLAAKAMRNR